MSPPHVTPAQPIPARNQTFLSCGSVSHSQLQGEEVRFLLALGKLNQQSLTAQQITNYFVYFGWGVRVDDTTFDQFYKKMSVNQGMSGYMIMRECCVDTEDGWGYCMPSQVGGERGDTLYYSSKGSSTYYVSTFGEGRNHIVINSHILAYCDILPPHRIIT